jgi:hypothetical protein
MKYDTVPNGHISNSAEVGVSFCHSVVSFPNPLISDSKNPIMLPRQPVSLPTFQGLDLQKKMGQCVFFSKIAKNK